MRWKQILQGFGEGVGIFLLVFLLFMSYGNINNRWYRLLVVMSGSMSPTINAGDMILVTPAPPTEKLRVGMIVSFRTRDGVLVTHRIVDINDGHITTKGDMNEKADAWQDESGEYEFTRVGGLYRAKLPYMGYPVAWLSKSLRPVIRSAQTFLASIATRAEFREEKSIGADFRAADHFSSPLPP